ncbi:radical SAM protein [Methylophaga sp.]|uniref:radical SAM protein n=1 Tax=Methylophaga sp. TaxID=2024840 RepID=UPI0014015684|nr:radical SAM protein [Methylophaga sp.]MTI64783.1 radical SAM protein [Methylophaga sp.]
MIAFGPVPSRRLGRSLGINNIPPKHCSYSCLYCQVGETRRTETVRQSYYKPQFIFDCVRNKVQGVYDAGESIDYLTFVPSGEPTLDEYLTETISLLKDLKIKIAVNSNASLIWRSDVQEALKLADWVSFKVDTVDESIWKKINRPAEILNFDRILSSLMDFAEDFDGLLTTETMLLDKVNTGDSNILRLADFLAHLQPGKAYIAVPTRPVTEAGFRAPEPEKLNEIFQYVSKKLPQTELLVSEEEDFFSAIDNSNPAITQRYNPANT